MTKKFTAEEALQRARDRASLYYKNNKQHVLSLARERNAAKPKKGRLSGASHPNWKGDAVGYYALHAWVERQLGSPCKCEVCGTTADRKYEWANLSHEYKRDLNDWKRMCVSCHRKYDIANGWGKPAGRHRKL